MRTLTIFLVATSLAGLPLCGCSTEEATPSTPRSGGTSGDGTGGASGGTGGTSGGTGGTSAVGGMSCVFDYTNYQPQLSPLTLKTDILPIIARSCALSTSCHRSGTSYPPSLGPGIVDGSIVATDAVLAEISMSLDTLSIEVPDWLRVKRGDPEHSYLMRKLDGSQRCGDLTCVVVLGSSKPCGERMPGGDAAPPLEPVELRKVRDWIKQGAN